MKVDKRRAGRYDFTFCSKARRTVAKRLLELRGSTTKNVR